jgi:hypothetical protein
MSSPSVPMHAPLPPSSPRLAPLRLALLLAAIGPACALLSPPGSVSPGQQAAATNAGPFILVEEPGPEARSARRFELQPGKAHLFRAQLEPQELAAGGVLRVQVLSSDAGSVLVSAEWVGLEPKAGADLRLQRAVAHALGLEVRSRRSAGGAAGEPMVRWRGLPLAVVPPEMRLLVSTLEDLVTAAGSGGSVRLQPLGTEDRWPRWKAGFPEELVCPEDTWLEEVDHVEPSFQGLAWRCARSDGVPYGPVVGTAYSGERALEGYYYEGRRHGPWTLWALTPQGWSKSVEQWNDGVREGQPARVEQVAPVARVAAASPVEKEEKREPQSERREVKTGRWQGRTVRGQREGPWTYYDTEGRKVRTESYRAGALEGRMTAFHANGKRMMEGKYKRGQREGVWQGWLETGKPAWKGRYAKGRPVGAWKQWIGAKPKPLKISPTLDSLTALPELPEASREEQAAAQPEQPEPVESSKETQEADKQEEKQAAPAAGKRRELHADGSLAEERAPLPDTQLTEVHRYGKGNGRVSRFRLTGDGRLYGGFTLWGAGGNVEVQVSAVRDIVQGPFRLPGPPGRPVLEGEAFYSHAMKLTPDVCGTGHHARLEVGEGLQLECRRLSDGAKSGPSARWKLPDLELEGWWE